MASPVPSPQPPASQDDPLARFSDLDRRKRSPVLYTVNGCGCMFVGRFARDTETRTAVALHVLTLFFLPVAALGAYRIREASGGGYLIFGKVPLPKWIRRANVAIFIAVASLAGGAISRSYLESPAYKDRLARRQAQEALTGGDAAAAVEQASAILRVGSPARAEVVDLYRRAFDQALATGSAAQKARAVSVAVQDRSLTSPPVPDLAERVTAHVDATGDRDPLAAAALMKAARPGVPETSRVAFAAKWEKVLEAALAKEAGSVALATDLAVLLDQRGETEACRKWLEPHLSELGEGEGARIYGSMLVNDGKFDEGTTLLERYVQPRMKRWKEALRGVSSAAKRVEEVSLETLRSNRGPTSFYPKWQAATENGRRDLVDAYIRDALNRSSDYLAAVSALEAQSGVVSAAFSLGLAQLRSAQALPDEAQRKELLEKAEKTFLSIRGAAGDSDEYKMLLAQVYHWMGRREEGTRLFDELLAAQPVPEGAEALKVAEATGVAVVPQQMTQVTLAQNRRAEDLERRLRVAAVLRQLGENERTRQICEDVFGGTADPEVRRSAAGLRALVFRDLDDRIAWLERGDLGNVENQLSLDEAKGHRLVRKGDREGAAALFRKVVAGYDELPRSSAMLNNSANVLSALHGISHDPADFREAVNRHEQSLRLSAQDTVLLNNMIDDWYAVMFLDLAGDQLDLPSLPASAPALAFPHLHDSTASWQKLRDRVRQSDPFRKARAGAEQLMVLAPRNSGTWAQVGGLAQLAEDLPAQRSALEKARGAAFEVESGWTEARKTWEGKRRAETEQSARQALSEWETALAALPKVAKPLSVQVARSAAAHQRLTLRVFDRSGDLASVVKEADALATEHPCSATWQLAVHAHLRAALEQTAAQDAALAAWVKDHELVYGVQNLVTVAMEQGTAVAALGKNAHVARAVEYLRRKATAYPDAGHVSDWAFLRQVDPASATSHAAAVLKNEAELVGGELDLLTTPQSLGYVLDAAWLEELRGRPEAAAKLRAHAKERGMPLP